MNQIKRLPNLGENKLGYIDRNFIKHLLQQGGQVQETNPVIIPKNYNVVTGQLADDASPVSVKPYEAVVFSGTSWITPSSDNLHLNFSLAKCYHFSETKYCRHWGIALDFITKTQPGRILMSGVTWLDTSSIGTLPSTTTHIHLGLGSLYPGEAGRAIVLNTASKPHSLVYLGPPPPGRLGRALEDIIADGNLYDVRLYVASSTNPTESASTNIKAFTVVGIINEDDIVYLTEVENRVLAIKLC